MFGWTGWTTHIEREREQKLNQLKHTKKKSV